jgi:hypothetical protein
MALVVIAVAAIILTGGLMASNMGFKLNYTLQAADGGVTSLSGFQSIGLPYNQQVGLNNAGDLLADITAGGVNALTLQRFDPVSDQNAPYPGPGGNFSLVSGEGYLLGVTSSGPYIIVGSHDPGKTINFVAADGGINSLSGFQRYAHPYHGVASTAGEFLVETGALTIQDFDPITDQNAPYPGPGGNFPLVPGKGYLVGVTSNSSFIPAHY